MTTIDPSRCPACGQQNHCARAGAMPTASGDCWCHRAQFSGIVLAALPADAKGKACVCAACARGDAVAMTDAELPPRA